MISGSSCKNSSPHDDPARSIPLGDGHAVAPPMKWVKAALNSAEKMADLPYGSIWLFPNHGFSY